MSDMFFTSEKEVIRLAGEFYQSRLPFTKWNKSTQLTVTLYYAVRFPYRMAFDLLQDRVQKISVGQYTAAEQRAELESNIHYWLQKAREFAARYRNIDDLSALANIFISTNWHALEPFPNGIDPAIFDADTARLDGAAVVV